MKSRLLGAAALAAALATHPGSAAAETRLARVPYRFLVVPPMEAGSKRVTKGQVAFEFPMRWEDAAHVLQDVELTADDRHQIIGSGQALAHTDLRFADPAFAGAKSFCVPRLADPMRKGGALMFGGIIGRAVARSVTDGQFCIVDRDQDGIADHSVLVNAGSPGAREPHPIAPTAYKLTPMGIVSEGDSIRFRYLRGADSFDWQIIEQGRPRFFQTFNYTDLSGRPHRFNQWLDRQKLEDGSMMAGPGLVFKVSGYDRASNSVLVQWERIAQPRIVPIPDDVKVRYGYF